MRLFSVLLLICLLAACAPAPERLLPTLAVLPSSTPPPLLLRPWQSAAGALDGPADQDTWQFTGRAGEAITLRTVVPSGQPPRLTLQRADGPALAQGASLALTLTEDAVYLVQVQPADAAPVQYEIGLGYADRGPFPTATDLPLRVGVPTPTPAYSGSGTYLGSLAAGEERRGRLNAAEEQVYTYSARAGTLFSVTLERRSGDLNPALRLVSPQGQTLAQDDDSGGAVDAALRNVRLPADGVYSLHLTGGGQPGDYALTLREGPQPFVMEATPPPTASPTPPYNPPALAFVDSNARLADHVPVLGTLARPGAFARYSFYAEAGQVFTLSVLPTASSGLRPLIELYDPDGGLLATASGRTSRHNGGALLLAVPATLTGPYFIILTGEDDTAGDFVLSFGLGTSHTDVYRGEAVAETRHEGTLTQRGVREVWGVAAAAGDVLTVAVSGGMDPLLEVYDPAGTLLLRDDNGGGGTTALVRVLTLPQAGVYTLRVSDASGQNIGGYTLVWRYISRVPTPTPAPAGMALLTVSAAVAVDDYAFYVFQGQAGQRVRVVVQAAGPGFDPVAVLLGPDGSPLAQGDDSGDALDADFVATLPADGTYSVRVNGYLSGGGFHLRVILLP
ncbi:MAG: PPC domain-containing protein [Anaerolineae bacterium]|jgi:hypothetical protein|nr:PPC domain-containing protein [Anaerolineae bacterium]